MQFWKSRKTDVKRRRTRKRLGIIERLEGRRLFAADIGLPPDMLADPYAFVGDHSASNSEIWSMQVAGQSITAPDFGEVARERLSLAKGESHLVSVSHVDTNRMTDDQPDPDYDYRAWIDNSASPAWTSGSSTPSGNDFFVDNSSGLLQRRYFGDDTNEATGTATIHVPLADLDIDSNNNGSFDDSDDWVELDSSRGRLVDVLMGDLDHDGVTDRNDFDGISGASFEPIHLSLSSNLAQAGSGVFDVTISYDMASITGSGGDFRLWTVDASQDRSDFSTLVSSGDTVSASSLGLNPGGSITLYLEAVNDTGNTVHFEEIEVDVAVSTSFFYGTLSDSIYAASVNPDIDAVPEITSIEYISDEGEQLVGIVEGSILPVSGTVKYRREVPSVGVEIWADLNFDGIKDNSEVNTIQAIQTDDSDVNGDRYYAFSTSFWVIDDGVNPGNLQPFDPLKIIATPDGGTAYNSFILAVNADPTWVDYPTLNPSFNEHGVIESSTISGIFRDAGTQDYHAVQVSVNGTQRAYEEYAPGVVGFSIDLGLLTPGDGDRITVKLLDDDLGSTTFYITLSTVVSKSFIANVYTSGGVGTVSSLGGLYPEEALEATARLQGFGFSTFAQFRENPGSPFSEGDFRLYSRDVYAVGFDGEDVQYYDHLTDGSVLNGGYEFGIFQGEIYEQDRYLNLSSSTTGTAGVFVRGVPDPFLEDGFDVVMTRESKNIWYELDVAFSMQGNFANFSVVDTDSSAFPSNRVWIDAELEANYEQSTLVKLWRSSPTLGSLFVVGRDETGIFENQNIFNTGGLQWKPVEN